MSKKLLLPLLVLTLTGCGADLTAMYLQFKQAKNAAAQKAAPAPKPNYPGVAVVNKENLNEVTQVMQTAEHLMNNRIAAARKNYGDNAADETAVIYKDMFYNIFALSQKEEGGAFVRKAGALMQETNKKYAAIETKYTRAGAAQSSYGQAVERARGLQNTINQKYNN